MTTAAVELSDVVKAYGGIRPLRIRRLAVAQGDAVALVGLDQAMAEVFVNLVTGAALPDGGLVRVFGRPTTEVTDSADWLALVDRFGIVSERSVLLDALSVIQNLSMPFTLEIDPPPEDIRHRAAELAREAGLAQSSWTQPVAELDAKDRARIRVARALALDPAILLLEHVTASVPREDVGRFGTEVRALARRRGAAIIAMTADPDFAGVVADQALIHEPATGNLKDRRRTGWFGGRLG